MKKSKYDPVDENLILVNKNPENIKFHLNGPILTIQVDTREELRLSKTRKNIMIACTKGPFNVPTNECKNVYVILSVYKFRKKTVEKKMKLAERRRMMELEKREE